MDGTKPVGKAQESVTEAAAFITESGAKLSTFVKEGKVNFGFFVAGDKDGTYVSAQGKVSFITAGLLYFLYKIRNEFNRTQRQKLLNDLKDLLLRRDRKGHIESLKIMPTPGISTKR